MKKIFIICCLLLSLVPGLCFADSPIIKSDSRTFDIMKGVYDLQGNVFVQFPAHDKTLTIQGDRTQVFLYDMEVHGKGNISLAYDELSFLCDQVDVYHKQRSAFVFGNCSFQHEDLRITADQGSFNWKRKLASFQGNVLVNEQPTAGRVVYHVLEKRFLTEAEITTLQLPPLPPMPVIEAATEADNKEQAQVKEEKEKKQKNKKNKEAPVEECQGDSCPIVY